MREGGGVKGLIRDVWSRHTKRQQQQQQQQPEEASLQALSVLPVKGLYQNRRPRVHMSIPPGTLTVTLADSWEVFLEYLHSADRISTCTKDAPWGGGGGKRKEETASKDPRHRHRQRQTARAPHPTPQWAHRGHTHLRIPSLVRLGKGGWVVVGWHRDGGHGVPQQGAKLGGVQVDCGDDG